MHSIPCSIPNWSLCLSIWAWIWPDFIWEPNWNEHQGKASSRVFERNRLCDTCCRKMASRILQLVFSPAKSRFWHFSWSLWRRRWLSYSHIARYPVISSLLQIIFQDRSVPTSITSLTISCIFLKMALILHRTLGATEREKFFEKILKSHISSILLLMRRMKKSQRLGNLLMKQ